MKILLFSIFFSVLVATSTRATGKLTGKVVTFVDGASLDIAKPDGQIEGKVDVRPPKPEDFAPPGGQE